jgi:RES domain-containing protein
MARPRRDPDLIDALEAMAPVAFRGTVWRVVRDGRDPLRCSASGGRWDDGRFDVLYTSQSPQGAVAELHFHLMRGQPVMPSQVRYRLFELEIVLERALHSADLDALAAVGLRTDLFGRLSWADKAAECPRSQDIAEVAHFLDCHGLIVPSARSATHNVVVFCDRVPALRDADCKDRGLVDWPQG